MSQRLKHYLGMATQMITVLAFLGAVVGWLWTEATAAAEEYVRQVVAPQIEEVIQEQVRLRNLMDELVTAQKVEADQSRGESEALDQLLCIQTAQVRGSDPSGCFEQ